MTASPIPQANSTVRTDVDEVVLAASDHAFPNDPANAFDHLRRLLQQIQHISSESQLDQLLARLMPAVVELTGAQRCFLLVRGARQPLESRCCWPPAEELPSNPQSWTISRTIVARVLERGEAILSNSVPLDIPGVASVSSHDIRAVLCVPLGPAGATVGVIYADHRRSNGQFAELDLRVLLALAQHAHEALRRARQLADAEQAHALSQERWRLLQAELMDRHQVVGSSAPLLAAYESLKRIAPKATPILITGPSGAGKELFARAAHALSPRAAGPFIKIDVAALPEDLVESELFGHIRGSFSYAIQNRRGRFALADGGTVFLDEIGNVPLRLQAKLLRVIESGEFDCVGSESTSRTDVRIVCATNARLSEEVAQQRFREDLYFRIAGATIELPSLAQRCGDIPELVAHTLRRLGSTKTFAPDALDLLARYSWPGNVRQLIHLVEVMDTVDSQSIRAADLPAHLQQSPSAGKEPPSTASAQSFPTLADIVAAAEREHMRNALRLAQGVHKRAIELLKMSNEQYFRKKKLYDL